MDNRTAAPEQLTVPNGEAVGRRHTRRPALPHAIEEELNRTLLSLLIDAVEMADAEAGAICLKRDDGGLEVAAFVAGVKSEVSSHLGDRQQAKTLRHLAKLYEEPRSAPRQHLHPAYHIVRAAQCDKFDPDLWSFPFWVSGKVAGFIALDIKQGLLLCGLVLETVTALALQTGLTIDQFSKASSEATDIESAALHRAAKLTEANAALKRALDVLAAEADVDRLLTQILSEIGVRLSAQRIVLWLPEGEQAPAIGPRLCWNVDSINNRSINELIGKEAAVALLKAASRFRHMRMPLLRTIRACNYLSTEDVGILERSGVISILHLPLMMGQCFLGAITVLFDAEVFIPAEDLNLAQAFAQQATLAVRMTQLSIESQNAAIARERARMSREIHDTTLQNFIGIIRHLHAHEAREPNVQVALSLAESGLAEARRAVATMRPSLLEGKPFVDALRDMALALPTQGLHTSVTSSGTPINLMPENAGNLFRIAQEAVNNVVHHASASELAIDVSFLPGEITVLVSDNGRGFDPDAVDSERGFGLISMKQRAQAIGAELVVLSEPGKGTQVYVSWRATSS